MESNQYRIQYGNVSIGGGAESSQNFGLSTTLGQTAAGQFDSQGYIIKAGFQYLHSIIPFNFKITDTQIDLGPLSPKSPKTATTTLIVDFGSAGQYQVSTIEEGPLKTLNKKNIIPDTQCNGGNETCNETKAAPWTNNQAYGFGFGLTGDDIAVDFINDNYFRPFPDATVGENPAVIMHSINVGRNRKATVTFKANVSPSQSTGTYDTVINFIALPSF